MIERDNVVGFLIAPNVMLIGETVPSDKTYASTMKIKNPFKMIVVGDDKVSVTPLFIKEEKWAILNPALYVQCEITNAIYEVYEDYCTKIFGEIVLASSILSLR